MSDAAQYDRQIIDAHHHYWDPWANPHPWLSGHAIPFRYGDYSALRRPFLIEDYKRASRGWNVIGTITMDGEWDPADPVGEARWISDLAAHTGKPAAHVAQAWLDRADLPSVLEAYQGLPLVRSVRHKPRANAAPGGPSGGMTDGAFQRGFRAVGAAGLHFDLQTPWWHLDEAVRMAESSPDTLIILNHAGLPADRSDDALAEWRQALVRFASRTRSVVKISGLGQAGQPWSLEANRGIIRDCIEIFGPERAMFASNFPVDGLCGSFDTIYRGFESAVADLSPGDQQALFRDTAAQVYGVTLEQL